MSNKSNNIDEIDAAIKKVVKNLGKDVLRDYKEFMEDEFFFGVYGSELELNVVIDANIILADANAYLKYGRSYLLELMESPFLKVFAPMWLYKELEKNIPKFSKDNKHDEAKFREAVNKLIAKVKIMKEGTTSSNNTILENIRKRDAKDLPYVILYVERKFHGILTKDRDVRDTAEITTWERPGEIGKIIQIFESGAFAYAVIGELPTIFTLLGELCILIIKGAWEVIKAVAALLAEAAIGVIDAITKLPDWMKVTAFIGTILLLAWDKSRTFITEGVKSIGMWLINFLKWIYNAIKSVLDTLGQATIVGIDVINVLFVEVERTIAYYEALNK